MRQQSGNISNRCGIEERKVLLPRGLVDLDLLLDDLSESDVGGTHAVIRLDQWCTAHVELLHTCGHEINQSRWFRDNFGCLLD